MSVPLPLPPTTTASATPASHKAPQPPASPLKRTSTQTFSNRKKATPTAARALRHHSPPAAPSRKSTEPRQPLAAFAGGRNKASSPSNSPGTSPFQSPLTPTFASGHASPGSLQLAAGSPLARPSYTALNRNKSTTASKLVAPRDKVSRARSFTSAAITKADWNPRKMPPSPGNKDAASPRPLHRTSSNATSRTPLVKEDDAASPFTVGAPPSTGHPAALSEDSSNPWDRRVSIENISFVTATVTVGSFSSPAGTSALLSPVDRLADDYPQRSRRVSVETASLCGTTTSLSYALASSGAAQDREPSVEAQKGKADTAPPPQPRNPGTKPVITAALSSPKVGTAAHRRHPPPPLPSSPVVSPRPVPVSRTDTIGTEPSSTKTAPQAPFSPVSDHPPPPGSNPFSQPASQPSSPSQQSHQTKSTILKKHSVHGKDTASLRSSSQPSLQPASAATGRVARRADAKEKQAPSPHGKHPASSSRPPFIIGRRPAVVVGLASDSDAGSPTGVKARWPEKLACPDALVGPSDTTMSSPEGESPLMRSPSSLRSDGYAAREDAEAGGRPGAGEDRAQQGRVNNASVDTSTGNTSTHNTDDDNETGSHGTARQASPTSASSKPNSPAHQAPTRKVREKAAPAVPRLFNLVNSGPCSPTSSAVGITSPTATASDKKRDLCGKAFDSPRSPTSKRPFGTSAKPAAAGKPQKPSVGAENVGATNGGNHVADGGANHQCAKASIGPLAASLLAGSGAALVSSKTADADGELLASSLVGAPPAITHRTTTEPPPQDTLLKEPDLAPIAQRTSSESLQNSAILRFPFGSRHSPPTTTYPPTQVSPVSDGPVASEPEKKKSKSAETAGVKRSDTPPVLIGLGAKRLSKGSLYERESSMRSVTPPSTRRKLSKSFESGRRSSVASPPVSRKNSQVESDVFPPSPQGTPPNKPAVPLGVKRTPPSPPVDLQKQSSRPLTARHSPAKPPSSSYKADGSLTHRATPTSTSPPCRGHFNTSSSTALHSPAASFSPPPRASKRSVTPVNSSFDKPPATTRALLRSSSSRHNS
ncbi:hypothetical protein DIPPA_20855 [Diplonema papillatum]|nr:hypothetical protein DIPPA_20855 [Diplonema papillatum]